MKKLLIMPSLLLLLACSPKNEAPGNAIVVNEKPTQVTIETDHGTVRLIEREYEVNLAGCLQIVTPQTYEEEMLAFDNGFAIQYLDTSSSRISCTINLPLKENESYAESIKSTEVNKANSSVLKSLRDANLQFTNLNSDKLNATSGNLGDRLLSKVEFKFTGSSPQITGLTIVLEKSSTLKSDEEKLAFIELYNKLANHIMSQVGSKVRIKVLIYSTKF